MHKPVVSLVTFTSMILMSTTFHSCFAMSISKQLSTNITLAPSLNLVFKGMFQVSITSLHCISSLNFYELRNNFSHTYVNYGQNEFCSNKSMTIDPQNLEQGKLTVFFHTSERVTKPGFRMLVVCFKPNEENFDGTYVHLYQHINMFTQIYTYT